MAISICQLVWSKWPNLEPAGGQAPKGPQWVKPVWKGSFIKSPWQLEHTHSLFNFSGSVRNTWSAWSMSNIPKRDSFGRARLEKECQTASKWNKSHTEMLCRRSEAYAPVAGNDEWWSCFGLIRFWGFISLKKYNTHKLTILYVYILLTVCVAILRKTRFVPSYLSKLLHSFKRKWRCLGGRGRPWVNQTHDFHPGWSCSCPVWNQKEKLSLM